MDLLVLKARADWLVKLRISCAIYLRLIREKMTSRFASATSEEINQINFLVYISGASTHEARQQSTMGMKIGNQSSRENLVMTSAYERPNERRPYRLWGWRRDVIGDLKECNLSSAGFVGKKTYFGISYVNERSGTLS